MHHAITACCWVDQQRHCVVEVKRVISLHDVAAQRAQRADSSRQEGGASPVMDAVIAACRWCTSRAIRFTAMLRALAALGCVAVEDGTIDGGADPRAEFHPQSLSSSGCSSLLLVHVAGRLSSVAIP